MAELIPLQVAVDTPHHTGISTPLTYASDCTLPPGTVVRVPLGRREVAGVVWRGADTSGAAELRPLAQTLISLPPMTPAWCALIEFAASYYQRGIGEVALSVLPPELRQLDDAQVAHRIAKLTKRLNEHATAGAAPALPELSEEQSLVLEKLAALTT